MDYKFKIMKTQSKDALIIRINSSLENLKNDVDKAYHELLTYLAANNEFPGGYLFMIYNNKDVINLDLEIGFPINRKFLGNQSISMGHTPGGYVLTCMHVGSYDSLNETYSSLEKYMTNYSLTPKGKYFEIYYNNPADTPINDLITEVGAFLEEWEISHSFFVFF